MSTAKSRARRTLPSLPADQSLGKHSPASSPLSKRKQLHSPSVVSKSRASKLPIPVRKGNGINGLSKELVSSNDTNLRKLAVCNSTSASSAAGESVHLTGSGSLQGKKLNGTRTRKKSGEHSFDKTMRDEIVSKNGLSKQESTDQEGDTGARANSVTSENFARLKKSESMTSLDSLCSAQLNEEERSCVTVAVRVRPFNQRESKNNNAQLCLGIEGNTILTSGPGLKHSFSYDQCFWSLDENSETCATQENVYEKMGKPLVENAFEGYNTCLFAYGQTGSGKSYSMMGLNQKDKAGVIPRFCEDLFERINTSPELAFTVEISYFEIYNEKIHDLLDNRKGKDNKKIHLRVREHPELGPYIQDLSTYIVSSYGDIESWLAVGNKCRATAATGMNEKSSRSHSVFTIILTQTQTQVLEGTETQMSKTSKINLIDLAGSERASSALNDDVIDSKETYDLRLKEGGSINKSLHTLGKVISVLSSQEKTGKKKKVHIPYRDSVLTWLLKDSLGGNSKTAMIATVSPSIAHYEETMSTLRYASQARCIVNRARVNEDPNAKLIRELMAEIDRLKESSISSEPEINNSLNDEITNLREKLKETTTQLAESTKNWQEKLELSEKRKFEEAEKLQKAGISFKVDNKLPNLVNLNEDPQLSEMLLYILKEGVTTVGRLQGEVCQDHDIQLNGVLVADNHCLIRNEGEKIFISPQDEAPTYLNGQLLSEETTLHHGDRLVIGGDHYFRFNHPIEVQKRKQENAGKERVGETVAPKDFEFARNELAQVQNARLQAELEEARIQVKEEIMAEIQVAKETAQKELTDQKQGYERRLTELQSSLKEVGAEKTEIEKSHQSAEDQISQLRAHKLLLEQEILNNRKRLQMEALAAKQALEETKINQVRIISELEKEKIKIKDDVEKLKNAKKIREHKKISIGCKDDKGNSELLRISVMLREANKISESMGKRVTFSRDDILLNDKVEVKIRLNNTKLGITTVWSLEKFQSKLMHMREMYQQSETESISGDEDPFNDSEDQWEKDFRLDSPSENVRMSRRDSLNLVCNLKNSLASPLTSMGSPSVLYGVSPRARVLVNNAVNRQEKVENIFAKYRSPSTISETAIPVLTEIPSSQPPPDLYQLDQVLRATCSVPAICREMISSAMAKMEGLSVGTEEPFHERIMQSVNQICVSIAALKKDYKSESGDHDGVPLRETERVRRHTLHVMTSIDRLLEQARSWRVVLDMNGTEKVREMTPRLQDSVRRVATHLSKLLMGCDGDMVSLIEESADKVEYNLSILAKQTAKLAVMSPLECKEDMMSEEIKVQVPCAAAFVEGQNLVLRDTLQDCSKVMKECLQNVQKLSKSINEMEEEMKDDASILLKSVLNFIRNEDDIQKSLAAVKDVTSQVVCGKRVFYCHQVVTRTCAIMNATEVLASAIGKRKIADAKLLLNMIEVSNEFKTSVNDIVENTQYLLEFDTHNCSEKSTATLFSLKDKLKIKAKNVRLTSRELTKTLKKYSFLCEERTSDRHAGSLYGTPISRGLRDRTNDVVHSAFQKRLVTEFGSPVTPASESSAVVVLRSKESPI